METKKTAVVLATVATMAVAPGAAFAAGTQADSSTVTSDAANDAVLTQTVGRRRLSRSKRSRARSRSARRR